MQIIGNILHNATKFMTPGGRIVLRVAREGGSAVFTVKDDGIGIPADRIDRVFDLFTQVHGTEDGAQGGSLGSPYPSCRRMLRAPHGCVPLPRAERELGRRDARGGIEVGAFSDRPEVREVVRFLLGPEFGKSLVTVSGNMSPNRRFDTANYRRHGDPPRRREGGAWPRTRSASMPRTSCPPRSGGCVLEGDDDLCEGGAGEPERDPPGHRRRVAGRRIAVCT